MTLHSEAEALAHELFRSEAGRRDPYPRLHRLREIAPVHRSEAVNAWVVTRYEDCRAILRDPRFGRRFAETLDGFWASWRDHAALRSVARMMLQLDAPEHTRLRRKVARSFTARRVEELRPGVEATVARLLEQVRHGDEDLMSALAFRLPMLVLGDLLGIPTEDIDRLREPALDLTVGLDVRVTPEQRDAANAASLFFDDYFTDLLARRRRKPGDDLLSALVTDAEDADPLTDRELLDMAVLLLIAGFETTTNTISAGLLALHDQPEQLAELRAGAHSEHVADEFLRHEAALQIVNRTALEDVEVGGQVIREGERVFVMVGAANRDPAVFDHPDRLDVTRERARHLSFGGGIHHCLGAALARLELSVLLEQLSTRFTSVELPSERPLFRDTVVFRALEALPVQLSSVTSRQREPGTPSRDACPITGARAGTDGAEWRGQRREELESSGAPVSIAEVTSRVALLEPQPLFSACRPSELVGLASTAYVLTFDTGETIVAQGDAPTDVFLLLEGEADVAIDGAVVTTLGVDDLIGERGAVTSTPRAATVTATGHVAALVISAERFSSVLAGNHVAATTMRAVTDARYPELADT